MTISTDEVKCDPLQEAEDSSRPAPLAHRVFGAASSQKRGPACAGPWRPDSWRVLHGTGHAFSRAAAARAVGGVLAPAPTAWRPSAIESARPFTVATDVSRVDSVRATEVHIVLRRERDYSKTYTDFRVYVGRSRAALPRPRRSRTRPFVNDVSDDLERTYSSGDAACGPGAFRAASAGRAVRTP